MITAAQLAELAAARGPAFDQLFVALMIAHHEGAIAMAEQVGGAGTDITVGEIAQDVVGTQTAEIDRLRARPPVSSSGPGCRSAQQVRGLPLAAQHVVVEERGDRRVPDG